MPKKFNIKLLKKNELSSQLYSFKFEKPFVFKAGQFVSFVVADKVKRYYSIASAPYEVHLELLVNTDPGGPGSKYFEKIEEGDSAEVMGPMGNFNFKSAGDVNFICTGTGLAPCISMIKEQLNQGYNGKLHLLFGTRYEKDVLKEKELGQLVNTYPNLSVTFSVTRPTQNWNIVDSGQLKRLTGRVTEHIAELPEDSDYYICGVKDMLESVRQKLGDVGVAKDKIFFEQY
ncbi:hypothetical protein GF389_04000 [Candidatus Dojkabacteria bacterium]|nr:hypothetical protein [Candidatus Dojkabacteria bacterium]